MDLSSNDLQAIKGIVETSVETAVVKAVNSTVPLVVKKEMSVFRADLEQVLDDKLRIQTDMLRQEIQASESRIKKEIISEVADFIEGSLLPQIDDHENRITKLETKPAV
jgi:hypothetical protein